MNYLDKMIDKLKSIRLEMIRSKSDAELLAILFEKETYEDDFINLVKNEITKRLIN